MRYLLDSKQISQSKFECIISVHIIYMSAAFTSITCTNSEEYVPPTKVGKSDNVIVIDGDTIRLTMQRTIPSATFPGYPGEICYDTQYIYLCIGEDKWTRIPLQSF